MGIDHRIKTLVTGLNNHFATQLGSTRQLNTRCSFNRINDVVASNGVNRRD